MVHTQNRLACEHRNLNSNAASHPATSTLQGTSDLALWPSSAVATWSSSGPSSGSPLVAAPAEVPGTWSTEIPTGWTTCPSRTCCACRCFGNIDVETRTESNSITGAVRKYPARREGSIALKILSERTNLRVSKLHATLEQRARLASSLHTINTGNDFDGKSRVRVNCF